MWTKKFLFGILFILCCFNVSYSQSGWVFQNPNPSDLPICNNMFFLNTSTGWLSNESVLLKTSNAGVSWTEYPNSQLLSLQFINENTGYAVIQNRGFAKTTNSGQNWILLDSLPTSFGVYTLIKFKNESTGFFSIGANFFKTTNGGNTFIPQVIPFNREARSVQYFDDNNIILFVNSTNFCKTTNGGDNWISYPLPSTSNFGKASFLNENTGWFTSNGSLYRTTNAGTNWILQTTNVANGCVEIGFVNMQTGYCSDVFSTLFKTTNGGSGWVQQNTNTTQAIQSLRVIDENNVILLNLNSPKLTRTTNGGNNWFTIPNFTTELNLSGIQAFNENTIYAVGANGTISTIIRSYDGGLLWTQGGTVSQNFGPTSLFFLNTQTGYISTSNQRVFKTTDGGTNWLQISGGLGSFSGSILSVQFYNEMTGWCSGNACIFKTTNGGVNWIEHFYTPGAPFIYIDKIKFVNANTGWAAGNRIYKSTNGGINWYSQSNEAGSTSLFFFNEQTGWAGGNFHIKKTTNGGNSWDSVGVDKRPNDICFVNSQKGWFVSQAGALYFTENGGNSWARQNSSPIYSNLVSISFINEYTGWVVGTHGTILKTTTGGVTFISQTSTEIPEKYSLYQNYPNPFNPSTNIKFDIHKQGIASLKVFDLLGKEMETLVDEQLSVGTYEVTFNASLLPSGIYFYVLKTGEFVESKKMVLVK